MIITIRTDKPEAEIGLYTTNGQQLQYYSWLAHRELSATLLATIQAQLESLQLTLEAIDGVVVYKGPGSFTGLRIGITIANTLSYALSVPIVGAQGEQWQIQGVRAILQGVNEKIVIPEYGAEAHITLPKK